MTTLHTASEPTARRRVEIPLLRGQRRVLVDHADDDVIGWCGGLGCGKSHGLGLFAMRESLTVRNNYGCVAAATFPQLRRATIRTVLGVFNQYGIEYSYNRNEHRVRVHATGSEFVFVSCAVPKEELQGPEFGWLAGDEGEGIGEEQWKALLGRVRRRHGASQRTILCFNPPHRGHWIEKHFLTDPVPGWTLIQSNTYENAAILGERYIRRMEGFYPRGTLGWRRYLNGEMGLALEGAVYPEWSPARHLIEQAEYERLAASGRIVGYVCGLDLGFGHPFAFLQLALTDEDVLIVIGEHHANGWSLAEHAEAIHDAYRGGTIFSDHQAQERHELTMLGVDTIPAPKHIGVMEGIEAVRQRLRQDRLLIVRGAAPALTEQMTTYRWARPKTDRGDVEFRDAPIKVNDDAQDALRYAVTGLDRAILAGSDQLHDIFAGRNY